MRPSVAVERMQALTRQTWRSRPGHLIGWRDPEGAEYQFDLDAGPAQVSIGRRAGNDVALPWDDEVSGVHARLERVGADWTLRDDGLSRNGTWVNGERLTGIRRLLDGDVVRVGDTRLTVRAGSLSTRGASGVSAADARVAVQLCGPLVLRIDGRRLEGELSGRMGRRLFAYLLCKRGQPVRRDELTGVLWPRALPASPQAGLSVHFARLRRLLGEHALVGRGEVSLDLGDDAFVDVEAAVGLAREARAQLVAGKFTDALGSARASRGILEAELLPEFAEDDWVAERRLELDSLVPELLEIEAEAALTVGGGELGAAEAAARALLHRRPYRESDCRLLMRAHAARGNLAEALLVYEELRHRLMDDLGIPPPAATRALYEQLLADKPSPSAPTATSPQER
jgi:DNA-binding SARP family transcriptional activator